MGIRVTALTGKTIHGKQRNFRVVTFVLNRNTNSVMDKIWQKGNELSKHVNPAAANQGDLKRNKDGILNNCVSGLLAEYCWWYYINKKAGKNIVSESKFTSATGQIDLLIENANKIIEIRSSFPRNGLEFAVFNPRYQFDILGPYSNTVKPGEIQKDYYLRTLYPFDVNEFLERFNSNIEVCLCGGATWVMMNDDCYYINKDLVPENQVIETKRRSTYRVIPLSLALDTEDITMLIINDSR